MPNDLKIFLKDMIRLGRSLALQFFAAFGKAVPMCILVKMRVRYLTVRSDSLRGPGGKPAVLGEVAGCHPTFLGYASVIGPMME